MTDATEKYVRELMAIKQRLSNLTAACQKDLNLQTTERQEISWNIARLSAFTADSIADIVQSSTQASCGTQQ